MFKKIKYSIAALAFAVTALGSQMAQTSDMGPYSTFEDYSLAMETDGKPKILVVGCGHGTWYGSNSKDDHTHPDCWTVNLKCDPTMRGFDSNKPTQFKANVQYDEFLSITTQHRPLQEKRSGNSLPLRDADKHYTGLQEATGKIMGYKNTFDVILLERPLPKTLNHPWTIWNVAHMLKVGGEILIDTTQGYDSRLYKDAPYFKSVCPQTTSDYPVNKDSKRLASEFGLTEESRVRINRDMIGVADYLNHWGFENIINVGDNFTVYRYGAYQRFTIAPGQGIETARKTSIVSAFKTEQTESNMELWAELIQKTEYSMPIEVEIKPQIEVKKIIIEDESDIADSISSKGTISVQRIEEANQELKTPLVPLIQSIEKEETETEVVELQTLEAKDDSMAQESELESLSIVKIAPQIEDFKEEKKVVRALSSEEERYIERGYKAIDLPKIGEIEKSFRDGRYYVYNDSGQSFRVQSLTGGGFGSVKEEARNGQFDTKIVSAMLSKNYPDNGQFRLSAAVRINFEGSKFGLIFMLKHEEPFQAYYVDGYGDEQDHGKLSRNIIGADRILLKPVERKPQPKVQLPVVKETKKDSFDLSNMNSNSSGTISWSKSPFDGMEGFGMENYGEFEEVAKASTLLPSANTLNPFSSNIELLAHNVQANKKVMNWIESEFRWRKETTTSHFWNLQALKSAYTRVSNVLQKKGSDEALYGKTNQYMISQINEWLYSKGDLLPLLIKKGFDWQS